MYVRIFMVHYIIAYCIQSGFLLDLSLLITLSSAVEAWHVVVPIVIVTVIIGVFAAVCITIRG